MFEILKWVWRNNGFEMSDEEMYIIFKYFYRNKCWENNEQLNKSYKLLQRIANDARAMQLDNAEEIVTICRKQFGEKMIQAYSLWGQESYIVANDYDDIILG